MTFTLISASVQSINAQASCPFNGPQGAAVVTDTDQQAPGTVISGSYAIYPASIAANMAVVGNPTATICYYGDMDNANETWSVDISGETEANGEGGFTPAPTMGNPRCRDYVLDNVAFQNDIRADGDMDFEFNNFGAGWEFGTQGSTPDGDEFGYFVSRLTFNYLLEISLTNSDTTVCTSGNDITFTSTTIPGTVAGDSGIFSIDPTSPQIEAALTTNPVSGGSITADLEVSDLAPGSYTVTYTYTLDGCDFTRSQTVFVRAIPNASLKDTVAVCQEAGSNFLLTNMFVTGTTTAGTFTVDGVDSDGSITIPPGGNTYMVTYSAANPDMCSGGPFTDTKMLTITTEPSASFMIAGASSPACSSTGSVTISLVSIDMGNSANQTFTVDGNPVDDPASVTLDAPAAAGTIRYEICMTATNTGGDCPNTACTSFVTRNDGNDCGANAAFDSECEPVESELCPIDTKSDLRIECGFFTLNLGQIANAGISPQVDELSCADEDITFNWTGNNTLDASAALPINSPGNPSIASIAGLGGFCTLVTETFCIPIPFSDDICPLEPLGNLLQCNTSISGLLSSALTLTTQGSRGGLIMVDTDGDGAFDYLAEEYGEGLLGSAPPTSGMITVPNNVVGSGYISVRNVYGFPDNPKGVCGDPAAGGPNLLDILPIGAIPVAGPIIENVLTIAGCSVDLSFTDEATVQVPVYNDLVPSWANCPEDDYAFSTTSTDCSAPANWSIPVAYDACTGLVMPYLGRTNGTNTDFFVGTASPEVVPGQNNLTSGVYQTGGPVLGSDLPAGVYEVEFTAYSCQARTSTCTFNLVVEEGDLQLLCPRDITVRTDDEVCSSVVSSLEPLSGLSCNSIINLQVDFPAELGLPPVVVVTPFTAANVGTFNLASGLTFPQGESTVTYTLLIDLNGDGDVTDPGENQVCDFTVTVVDGSRPTPLCSDVEVTLDNTGNIMIFAEDQMDGSAFVDAGSFDNCDGPITIQLQSPGEDPVDFVNLECENVGTNVFNLIVTDAAGNMSTCITQVEVNDFFDDISLEMDLPELCLESVNPEQLDFTNYLNITLPDGTVLEHSEVMSNAFLGDTEGGFGITAFYADQNSPSTDPGSITTDGIYTPGTGSGYVVVSYVVALPGVSIPQNGNIALSSCIKIVHATFELRQPLEMDAPECECIVQNDRIVNLGEVTGGLEPYTIQYSGVQLDINSDGIADDVDGEYVYGVDAGSDITDFTEDLGNLLVDYTQPTWSFTIVDARGCELFRSGSCDNDDLNGTPEIICEDLGPVELFTEPFLCEAQYSWDHPLPTDNCDVILYTYTITNPDGSLEGPFDLTALLNPEITNPNPDQFSGEYEFQHISPSMIESQVTYYAEDAVGNFTTCTFTVTVEDDDKPFFINCPEPAVVVDAIEDQCVAYANYSLPLAEDNCSFPIVTQVDTTGLSSGDLYPVGITINTFEAVDPSGNTIRCDVKVIVNDIFMPPVFDCPDDVVTTTDAGDCGAIVNDIAPSNIMDNCMDNVTTIYQITDESGNVIESGFDDASGTFFDLGISTVSYGAQDMPLLLITEVTQAIGNPVDGTEPIPVFAAGIPASGDFVEITNFNSATLDVSCLTVERYSANGLDTLFVPTFTLLEPGGTLVIHFGTGTDDPASDFYNDLEAMDLEPTDPAAYVISLTGEVLDVVSVNGYDLTGLDAAAGFSGSIFVENGAGVIRTTVFDTDNAADFVAGDACTPTTIGMLNPQLAQPTPNGALTAIQAQPVVRVTCTPFTVTVTDEEAAVCGLYSDYEEYSVGPISVEFGQCVETNLITVTDDVSVADVNLLLQGDAGDLGNLTITLISPEGTEVTIVEAMCAGTSLVDVTFDGDAEVEVASNCALVDNGDILVPTGNIEAFNGESALGEWMLQIANNGGQDMSTATFDIATLLISARDPFTQMDVELENEPDLCGAEFTYFQAILFDNCPGGTVVENIIFEDGSTLLDEEIGILDSNTQRTFFFPVGVSTVTFFLTDLAGNESSCSFDVTVLDTENPVLICPADTTLQLLSGECEIRYMPDFFRDDNCFVSDVIAVPSFSTPLPIGENVITLTVQDSSGNDTTCMYTVTVLENIPDPVVMACITDINIHLGPDCEQEIIPEMVLTGNDFFCFDTYIITLLVNNPDGTQDTLPDNFVGLDEVGLDIIYQILEPRTDQACWGNIEVGFFEAPIFTCPADTFVSCNALTDVALLGSPIVTGCAAAGNTITFADTIVRNELCDDPRATLFRTFTVTDDFGNAGSCVQTITFEAFDLDQVIFPADFDGVANDVLSCADVSINPTLTDPINTGFPTVSDGDNIFQNNFCSASFLYTDEVFEICAGSFEILRTWKVRNTCLPVIPGVNPLESIQIIRVLDPTGPVLTCPDSVTISTGPFGCNGVYAVPEPIVEQGCAAFTYTVTTSAGIVSQLPDGAFVVSSLELGVHSIQYEVEDECGGFSSCIYFITVTDGVSGTAICEDGLNVSLDQNGTAQLTAEDIDGGSDDLCSTVTLDIRRTLDLDPSDCSPLAEPTQSPWGPTVDLNCCDIPDSLVYVELRVTDSLGNQSTCWSTILVEDKLAPICVAPQPLQIDCQDLQDNFPADLTEAFAIDPVGTVALLNDAFGTAVGVDNCGDPVITQNVLDLRTNCGSGTIIRTFTATDDQGLVSVNACTQEILVQAVNDYTIVFPGDEESDDCVEPAYNGFEVFSETCDLFTTSISVDTFSATAEECYKLRLTYEVINWCEYVTEAAAYEIPRDADGDGVFVGDLTVIHVIANGNGLTDDVAYLDHDTDRTNGFIDELDFTDGGVVSGANGNAYGSDPSRGYFTYAQFIKVYDDSPATLLTTQPDSAFCVFNNDCLTDLSLEFSALDTCTGDNITITAELNAFIDPGPDDIFSLAEFVANGGDFSEAVVALGNGNFRVDLTMIPIGRHSLRIIVGDGCGNIAVDQIIFDVVDCKAPTPICINGLTATLMPDGLGGGMAAIWASDFIASGSEDCSGPVKFAIYRQETANEPGFVPNALDTGLVLDCDDLGPLAVRIYAIDAIGNADFCETSLIVQAFQNSVCTTTDGGSLSGSVMTVGEQPVAGVSINIANDAGGNLPAQLTSAQGIYAFNSLAFGEDYTLSAVHNPAISLDNVSTGDLVLIARHILGLTPFVSPYQEIAADVTLDGTINVVDIIQIRQVILGINDAYAQGDSWSFHGTENGEIISSLNYNNLAGNVTGADFIAVERGNVSDALATPDGFSGTAGDGRASIQLHTEDLELIAGNTYSVSFAASSTLGWQATLELSNGLELIEVVAAESVTGSYNLEDIAQGLIAMSFVDQDQLATIEEQEQFTLELRATQNGRLSDQLRLSDRITRAEAYHTDNSVHPLALTFGEAAEEPGFLLVDNVPNPFAEITTIRYQLPEAYTVELSVRDVTGKLVYNTRADAGAGWNELTVSVDDLGSAGVFTYTLQAGPFVRTRKMVVVR